MTTYNLTRPFKRDAAGNPIPGGREITQIRNISITAAAWTAIKSTHPSKGFLMRCRSGNDFYICVDGDGTNYYTVSGELAMNLASDSDERILYAKGGGNEDLEVLFYD